MLISCSKNEVSNVHSCYGEYLCTSDGSIIRWQKESIEFAFEDTAPDKLRLAMSTSAKDYNDVFEKTELLIDEDNDSAPPYKSNYTVLNQDGINSIYYVTAEWPWATSIKGSLAVTLTRYDSNGIQEADIFVKQDPSKYNVPDSTHLAWITYIATHELGHALGRSHSKEKGSVMLPSISLTKVNTLANEDDFMKFFSPYDIDLFGLAYK